MNIALVAISLLGWQFMSIWLVFSLFFRETLQLHPFGRFCTRAVPSIAIVVAVCEGAAGHLGWIQISGLLMFALILPFDRNIIK